MAFIATTGMEPLARLRRNAAVIGISLFALLFYWSQTSIFGFRFAITGATVTASDTFYRVTVIERGGAAARAGLRLGDIVPSSFDGNRPADALFMGDPQPPQRLKNAYVVVRRNGKSFGVTVQPQSAPMAWTTTVRIIARLLSYTIFVILGASLLLIRPSPMTWLLFIWCLGYIAPSGDIREVFDILLGWRSTADRLLTGIDLVFPRMAISSLPLFALYFPSENISGWKLKAFRILAIPLALYAAWAWTALVLYWSQASIIAWIDIAVAVLTLSLLAATYVQSNGLARQRLRWGLTGMAIGIGCAMANEFARVVGGNEAGITIGAGFTVLAVLMPICLFYAIIRRHEILDVRNVVSRTAVYSVLTALVVGMFSLLDWTIGAVLQQARWALVAEACATILIGFSLNWLHARVEHFVGGLLFRERHSCERYLRTIALALSQNGSREEIGKALVEEPLAALSLTSVRLMRRDDSGFAELANRVGSRNSIRMNGKLVIPVRVHSTLHAIAVYDGHRNGEALDERDVAILEELAHAASRAYEHAWAQEAGSVMALQAARIRELEQRLSDGGMQLTPHTSNGNNTAD